MRKFKATLEIIGVNPFVFVPDKILNELFKLAGKDKGFIPVTGTVNGKAYAQTLVKYSGEWRLYINTTILNNSPEHVGEKIDISIEFDSRDRTLPPHTGFIRALLKNQKAKKIYEGLSPSLQKEINRYISNLKSEAAVTANIEKAIGFLEGRNRFIGREMRKN